jgi:hypothetical protein
VFNEGKEERKETMRMKGKLNVGSLAEDPYGPKIAGLNLKAKPLIVLDSQNIAMRHGNKKFSCRGNSTPYSIAILYEIGIEATLHYWKDNGHEVIMFLPDYLLDYDKVGEMKRMQVQYYVFITDFF